MVVMEKKKLRIVFSSIEVVSDQSAKVVFHLHALDQDGDPDLIMAPSEETLVTPLPVQVSLHRSGDEGLPEKYRYPNLKLALSDAISLLSEELMNAQSSLSRLRPRDLTRP